MRVIATRFALGALVLGSVCVIATPADAGPFGLFGRRRAMANDCCCYGGTAGGYATSYPASGYAYSGTPCCGGSVAYGSGYYQPGYATSSYYGGQVYPAGGYLPPGGNTIPAGGLPAPMPGAGQPGGAGLTNAEQVKITDSGFQPATLTVAPGTTIRWTNEGKTPHTVTSDKDDWGSNEIAPGGEFSATFTKPGTFEYHCKRDKDMKGKVVVK